MNRIRGCAVRWKESTNPAGRLALGDWGPPRWSLEVISSHVGDQDVGLEEQTPLSAGFLLLDIRQSTCAKSAAQYCLRLLMLLASD